LQNTNSSAILPIVIKDKILINYEDNMKNVVLLCMMQIEISCVLGQNLFSLVKTGIPEKPHVIISAYNRIKVRDNEARPS
jgi:hypothetical protein